MEDKKFTYVSFGAGVQSSALLVMSALGLHGCPKADMAIFADTGDEPEFVYDHLITMMAWGEAHGMPIQITSHGHLSQDIIDVTTGKRKRAANIPAFFSSRETGKTAILRRQCTADYKVSQLQKEVRSVLGYKPRQRLKHRVTALIGISIDEASRMKDARHPMHTHAYPLIDAGMDRGACIALLREHGLPAPEKSACVFCPFHDNKYWNWLKTLHPVEFQKAVVFDRQIRPGVPGIKSEIFLHRSRTPLDMVDFGNAILTERSDGFDNECEGVCGV